MKSHWYAVYTRSHHEKEVYRIMQEQGISAYLPLYTTIRQWSDRKKKVTLPLFSCYVFVYITNREYYNVLNIPGVIRYVTFEGKAVPIPENQILMVKKLLDNEIEIEEAGEALYDGAKVEIIRGPLIGIKGELIDFAGKKRVIIRLDEIRKSVVISVPANLLKLLN
jgi:transcriptional antiterminator RfaH